MLGGWPHGRRETVDISVAVDSFSQFKPAGGHRPNWKGSLASPIQTETPPTGPSWSGAQVVCMPFRTAIVITGHSSARRVTLLPATGLPSTRRLRTACLPLSSCSTSCCGALAVGARSSCAAGTEIGCAKSCCYRTLCNICTMFTFPQSQSELIRTARGTRSQVEFSRLLHCDRSCLSRYEAESLGAPPHVITQCLQIVAAQMATSDKSLRPFGRALTHARQAVAELELLERADKSQETANEI